MEKDFEIQLTDLLGETVLRSQPVAGGDISEAYLLRLQNQKVFCKLNYAQNAYSMFISEAAGLKTISDSGAIKTPEIIGCSELKRGACLLLEYIEPGKPTTVAMRNFGRQLAALHLISNEDYGLEEDNYIGSLQQSNTKYSSWASFYARERLLPQLQLACEKNLISTNEVPQIQNIENTIDKYTAGTKPGLLHGDLWRGNFLISTNDEPYLIDPAAYYGHSEVDIAMTKLFGGFSGDFYTAYHEIIPLSDGYVERQDLYQLYYLLVHLNLFGRSYYPAVAASINTYF